MKNGNGLQVIFLKEIHLLKKFKSNQKMPGTVIFDMDGVIIDSEPVHYTVSHLYFKELRIQVDDEEYKTFVGTTDKEMFTRLKSRYGIEETVEMLAETYQHKYMEYLRSSTDEKPVAGILYLLEELKKAGYHIALASSASRINILAVLDMFGINEYFDVVVSGNEVKESKPAPDVFVKAAHSLGVKPEECVVIEDSTNGVKAAKAAGMKCMAYLNPNSGNQDLSLADIIVDIFNEKCLDWIKEQVPAFR
jgi:beta-phosphoglucomutase family hydrolase